MDFKLPDIGEGVHEGEITKWLVKAGEKVEADQPMVEVMTDKATVEIPSPVTGTVSQLLADEGQTVEVGTVIIQIGENGGGGSAKLAENAPEPAPEPAPSAGSDQPVQRSPKSASSQPVADEVIPFKVLATPATRKLARDLNVDLSAVQPTGKNGRVTKEDVRLFYESQSAATPRTSHPTQSAALPATQQSVSLSVGEEKRIPLKGIRKAIAKSMARSKSTAAHFTYVEEVDMSALVQLRKQHKPEAEKRGVKLTYLPFIIKAVIATLKEFPYLNASLDDDSQEIVLKGAYNIGVATDTPQGLMVPVIKDCDRKNVWELASEITDLSTKVREGKASLEDLSGGTFTLTNAGSIGGVFATPVINHPEVAILGVNAIRKRPVVKDDQIVIADVMFLSISVDHRVVDGADAARFMNRLIYFLSDPVRFIFA